jgi:Type II secretion system (T2SS), protein E, N-terminal domain
MNCQNDNCDAQQGWIRSRVLSRPGFYLESEWYCGDACLQQGIVERLKKRKQARDKSFQSLLRLKLGHILLENGAITRAQLDKAIEVQQKERPSGRLGSILKELEFVKERDVTLALCRQYGLPLVNLKNKKVSDAVIRMVPLEIVRYSTFFPMEYDSFNNTLVLVTYDPSDINNMINLRSILKCEVAIYLGDESVVREFKESFCRRAADQLGSEELLAAEVAEDLQGLASFIVNRAKALNATTLNVKYFNQLIWTRFTLNRQKHDMIVNAA